MAQQTRARPRVGIPWRTAAEEAENHRPRIDKYLRAVEQAGGEVVLPVKDNTLLNFPAELYGYESHDEAGKLTGGKEELDKVYYDFYRNEPYTRVVQQPPESKHTLGSNLCLLYPAINLKTGRVVVVSCIDNLVKGAAGQAVQNMNIMFGLPETSGLEALPLYP